MTVGSAGAINTVLKAMLDPGDEVIVLKPYFPEYRFYIENHGGRVVEVETLPSFQPDLDALAAAITPRTRALILNSPNNPTGAVYPAATLDALEALLSRYPEPPVVISDEPYRQIVFDGLTLPETAARITHAITATSWSKTWAVAGERIGYLAISPRLRGADALRNACTFTNRILGYINAPALWQRVVRAALPVVPDVSCYVRRRAFLCDALEKIGYQLQRPAGTFYVFPRSPLADDLAFVRLLVKEGVLAVPGTGFGGPGHLRLALTAPDDVIERSVAGFARAFEAAARL